MCMYVVVAREKRDSTGYAAVYLAQLQYHHDIMEWENKGVPFCSRMYVPEVHPLTGNPFNEREDEAHVFKVYIFRYT